MKEYGINNSWHKEVVIKQEITVGLKWPMYTPIHLIAGTNGVLAIKGGGNVGLGLSINEKTISLRENPNNV
ncbi:hypothetical protein OSB04_016532 [Centaurea solstitialis]|uniref:Uncharacterized protein n=1 Tax=Centaurea solstitialis TaxID=347529 RepID=A0AA38W8K5_9ASTR|nr:hypothetical protein OSB04_016532 [Centaurea solstitialis]